MELNKSTTLEKIQEINPGGISNNRLIAQLNRILEETKSKSSHIINSPQLETNSLSRSDEQVRQQLTNLLSKTPKTEQYREQIKQQYLSNYLVKFGVEPNNKQPKQQTVIEQLERLKQRTKQLNESLPNSTEQQNKPDVVKVIQNIITKGKDIGNRIRNYTQSKNQFKEQDISHPARIERSFIKGDPQLKDEAQQPTDQNQQLHQRSRIQPRKVQKDKKGPEIND